MRGAAAVTFSQIFVQRRSRPRFLMTVITTSALFASTAAVIEKYTLSLSQKDNLNGKDNRNNIILNQQRSQQQQNETNIFRFAATGKGGLTGLVESTQRFLKTVMFYSSLYY